MLIYWFTQINVFDMECLQGFMIIKLLSFIFVSLVSCELHCRISNVSDSSSVMYTVDCSQLKLDSVPSCDQLFVECKSVSKLILKNNKIKELQNGSFKKYTGLKELDLSGNPIQQCLNGSFHGLANLKVLRMTEMSPDTEHLKFQNETFTPLVSIKSLDMSSSMVHLKSLFSALCSLNPNIEKLILNEIHKDHLSVILSGKFSHCFSKLNLKHFEFEKNRVMTSTLGGMMNFRNLQYISVARNNIVLDRAHLFMVAAFHNLTYLDVSCQKFGNCILLSNQSPWPWSHYLQGPALSESTSTSTISQVQISPTKPNISSWYFLSKLHTLDISFNNLHLTFLPSFCWKDNHLVKVDFSYSDYIELHFFDCLIFLKYVNLRNIRKLGIHNLSFHGWPSLEILMLGSSNLKDSAVFTSNTSSVVFEKNRNLKFLDMSKLGLTKIHKHLFSSLQKLEVLILSQNYITTLEGELISNLLSIQHLDLSNNSMKNIPMSVLTHMEKGLSRAKRHLHIGNNPFLCVCSTIPQIERVLSSKVVIPDTGLQCTLTDARTVSFPKAMDILKSQCHKLDNVSIVFLTFLFPLVLCIMFLSTWSYRNRWNIQYLWYKSINLVKVHEMVPDEDNAVFDVFIAHSQHDEEWVRLQLVRRLESGRPPYSCCVHDRNFLPGEYIADNIISAIRASKKTILVVTKKFVASGWCDFESRAAQTRHLGKTKGGIIAVVFPGAYDEAAKRKPGLCGLLDCVTYLPWTEDRQEQTVFWLKLRIALGRPKLAVQRRKGAISLKTVRLVNM